MISPFSFINFFLNSQLQFHAINEDEKSGDEVSIYAPQKELQVRNVPLKHIRYKLEKFNSIFLYLKLF